MGDVERELAWPVLDEVGRPVVRQYCLSACVHAFASSSGFYFG